jgi:hypothetical protein
MSKSVFVIVKGNADNVKAKDKRFKSMPEARAALADMPDREAHVIVEEEK